MLYIHLQFIHTLYYLETLNLFLTLIIYHYNFILFINLMYPNYLIG